LTEETGYTAVEAHVLGRCHISADRVNARDSIVWVPRATRGLKRGEFHAAAVSLPRLRTMVLSDDFQHHAALGALLHVVWAKAPGWQRVALGLGVDRE
jgi:hypothetical protein